MFCHFEFKTVEHEFLGSINIEINALYETLCQITGLMPCNIALKNLIFAPALLNLHKVFPNSGDNKAKSTLVYTLYLRVHFPLKMDIDTSL